MAQPDKRMLRRQSRAERKAQQEALEKARAIQEEKERKQQTMIGIAVVAAVVAFVLIIVFVLWRQWHQNHVEQAASEENSQQLYQAIQDVEVKPSKATDDGGFLISNLGYNQTIEGAPTITVVMDPLCPGCGSLNRQLDPSLIAMMQAGQINLEIHAIAFMDSASTDNYSSRASGSITYIAEHDDDPIHLLQYISNLYDENFQPGEGSAYESVSDDQLRDQALAAGVDVSVADNAFSLEYQNWLMAVTNYTISRVDLRQNNSFSTPSILINGTLIKLSEAASLGLNAVEAVLKSIGLQESNIGVSGIMPSIGTGAPNSLS